MPRREVLAAMPGKLIPTPYDDLTYRTIGIAMASHRHLGPGLREDTYQRDLETQFATAGLSFLLQWLPDKRGRLVRWKIIRPSD